MNIYEKVLRKIQEDEKCKPSICCYPIVGPTGPQGAGGGILNFADFYALMPPDNAATITPLAGGTQAVSAHLIITQI